VVCVLEIVLGWRLVTHGALSKTIHVSNELFNSLEELSRIVDISYCVGTTGVEEAGVPGLRGGWVGLVVCVLEIVLGWRLVTHGYPEPCHSPEQDHTCIQRAIQLPGRVIPDSGHFILKC
jgi:hypothetical protein